jgi:hypothetical protein
LQTLVDKALTVYQKIIRAYVLANQGQQATLYLVVFQFHTAAVICNARQVLSVIMEYVVMNAVVIVIASTINCVLITFAKKRVNLIQAALVFSIVLTTFASKK